MTVEKLKEAASLHNEINKLEKQSEELGYALNCLSSDNCKSAKIKILAKDDNNNNINDTHVHHDIEVGNLIFLLKEKKGFLDEQIDELKYKFKSM